MFRLQNHGASSQQHYTVVLGLNDSSLNDLGNDTVGPWLGSSSPAPAPEPQADSNRTIISDVIVEAMFIIGEYRQSRLNAVFAGPSFELRLTLTGLARRSPHNVERPISVHPEQRYEH